MEFITELDAKIIVSKTGNKRLRKHGLFKCPVCKAEVEKEYTNGIRSLTCGSTLCKDTKPKANYHFKRGYYNSWSGMKQRCNDLSDEYYGAKGITYDIKWDTFEGFWEDMKEGWFVGAEIDRKDANKHYCLDNCRWLTKRENAYRAHHRPINKIDLTTGSVLKMYPSVSAAVEAGEATNTSQLSRVARGIRPHYLGFGWVYPTDKNKRKEYKARPKQLITNTSNPVYSTWVNVCFRHKGNVVLDWVGEGGFNNFLDDMYSLYFEGAYLVRVNKSKAFSKENCLWEHKSKATGRNRQKAVLQLERGTDILVREWDSAKEAAVELSIDPSSLTKVCKGKKKSAGGYSWKYAE